MTIVDGKYPNKKDLEPKILHPGKGVGPAYELPLADPADSNFTNEFRKNAQDKIGMDVPSAFSQNKPLFNEFQVTDNDVSERMPIENREFDSATREKWNSQKRNDKPIDLT
ncbi:hypothetical protein QTL97_14885 [Sporosarcina thermotolerans]|uniref:Uncharacterized protein n=1 Tax=Sporosarcina thermotolerans TaxID=633404 RepID=A0AAW9A9A1_9BACL|nr:hypothetical protein [Sporosarcina thermotolerans]MDW0118216.1 hypothetical protein [Sporosarcina thermotolerans]WHT48528.1 hypothetical protein QNH10_01430 [Sporosarcina thermotolerans]